MCDMSSLKYREMIYSIVVPGHLSYEEKNQRYQPLTDFLQNNIPKKLYRFRKCKNREISEFEQDILGFSPPYKMNDDFDGLLYFDKKRILQGLEILTPVALQQFLNSLKQGSVLPVLKNESTGKVFNQFAEFLLNIPENAMCASLSRFKELITEELDNRMSLLSHITQNTRVASLTSDIESPALWGYYAEGTGFALAYDFCGETFEKYCPLPVIYGDDRLNATEYANWLFQQQILQSILNYANSSDLYQVFQHSIPCPDEFMCGKILIHKATAWEPEKEWRLIYFNIVGETEEYPHIIKRPSALYLGRHIEKEKKERLCQIAEKHHIPVYQMSICEDDPKYRLHPISV